MWTDKTLHIDDNLYAIFSAGDGFRLGRKTGSATYNIVYTKSTILQLYKHDNIVLIKANPLPPGTDTSFYKIYYKKSHDTEAIIKITLNEFDSLRIGLPDLLGKGKWE